MTNQTFTIDKEAELKKANAELVKENYELKKKHTKGEINEAYALKIERDAEEIRQLKIKVNKLNHKVTKTRNVALDEVVKVADKNFHIKYKDEFIETIKELKE